MTVERLWASFHKPFQQLTDEVCQLQWSEDASPIERLLGAALVLENLISGSPYHMDEETKRILDCERMCACVAELFGRCGTIFNQVRIGRYRVDFLILLKSRDGFGRVVVESDGHDFHERTKEQASHDKVRDRYLQQADYKVLRFTGSEVWADAHKCARQVFDIARAEAAKIEREHEGDAHDGAV